MQTSDEYYDEDPEYPEGANDDNDDTLDDADEKEYAEDFAEDTDDALTDDTNAGDNPGDIVEDDGLTTQEYYDESHEDSEGNEITPRSGADGGNGPPKSKTGTRTGDLKLGDDDYAEDPEYPEGENDDNDHTLDDADEKEFAEDFADGTEDASTDDSDAGDNAGDNVEYDDDYSGVGGGNGPPDLKAGNRDLQINDDDYAEDPENTEDENYDHSHEDTKDEYSENNDEDYEDSEGEVPESNDESYDDNHEDSEEYEEYSEHDIDDEKG